MNRHTDPRSEALSASTPLGLEHPRDILSREDLNRSEKIAVLEQWAQDLREQMVAEEEAMPPAGAGLGDTLAAVLQSLDSLGAPERQAPVPTKHG